MLSPTGWWLAVAPADLRCGIDRLLAEVRDELGQDVRTGGAYAFRNRSATRMKVVCVDAQGVWLCTRRVHRSVRSASTSVSAADAYVASNKKPAFMAGFLLVWAGPRRDPGAGVRGCPRGVRGHSLTASRTRSRLIFKQPSRTPAWHGRCTFATGHKPVSGVIARV